MRNPIENLGNYNKMRMDLQSKNGDLDALYKDIGNAAVAKATPELMLEGFIIGSAIEKLVENIFVLGHDAFLFWKEMKTQK